MKVMNGSVMRGLTIEQAALRYAWQLGYDDYPSTDGCIYNHARSPALHAAYWNGWKAGRGSQKSVTQTERRSV